MLQSAFKRLFSSRNILRRRVALAQQVVGIVGMGPIGTILGAYLVKAGVKVYGVEKDEARAKQINEQGLVVRGFTTMDEKAEACFTDLADLAEVQNLSAVFLCTKTWAIELVMKDLVKHPWPDEMRIVAFMNGIGPEDAVGEYVSKDRVCRCVVNYAANLKEGGEVTMNWFHPPNLIGPANEREAQFSSQLEDVLTGAGLTTIQVSHEEMKKAAFFKTILNSALNALCAAHGLTMSQAMRLKHTRRMARVLLREGLTLAGLVGYHYGEDTFDRCMEYLDAGGDHYPSMWFDLRDHRPTEIEFINGKIVKIGRMFAELDVQVNAFFTSAIITQEIKNGNRDEEDIPDYLVHG
jgi:2-dehydropantoate 2-reductase